ncbi:beta strand repeat-containing protein [Cupriavidus metallidurans]|uniref:beta strand repeat-containing protein n=1 Tax=Cupriavidus metallidurans TaxID=119219 RepID=UPI001F43ADAA|nr:hypothetical protein [Cupriavidus metallidurans]
MTTAKLAAGAVSATQLASNAVTTDKLAAGAVTATELAAGAVTAGKLAASAVTAGTIAAGAVSATELAANAVTTAKLAAGAVTANELAANSVVAAKIAAGSVSAIALAANSVTAGKIAADAVTAGTVAAGAVSTRELAAGSITATKLALGDTSNLYPDASFSDLSFYSSANGTFRFGTTGTTVATAILMLVDVSATDAVEVFSKDFAMEPSKPYFFSGIVRRTLTANQSQPSMAVEWLSGSPGAAPVVISRQVFATNDPSNRSTFRQTAILTAPANARAARLVFITTAAPDGSSSLFVEPIIRRAANGELIVDGSITTQKLVANAVTTNELAASAVTATQLAAGAVTAGKLSANAVTAGTIAAGAVSATELAANAVTTAKLAAGAVTTVQLAAGSVTTANLTAGAVTANELSAGAVTAGKIAANAVTAGTIAAGAVTTTQLAANAVTSVTIAASAVTATELAAGSVVTNKIAAGAVTANELAANSVTAGKVAANAVTAGTIAANAVTTGTIAAGAVTASQIAAGAITAAQMAANSVTAVQLAAGAVTATSIAANAVTAGKIATDAVTAGTVAANAISAREIAAGAITAQKLAIGDFENLVPGATFANGLAGWTAYGSWRVSCTVTRKAGTSGGNIGVFGHFQLQDGSGAGSAIAGTTSATSVIGAQVDVSGLFTVPDNAVAASFQIYYGSNASSANGDVVVTNIAVRRVVGSTVIADGAITTDKLLAGAVTANALAANAVTAGKIAANAVTAGTVVAGAISATELAAGAVTTAKIAAGAVTATSIATYAVTTAKIAAGAVTANEIAANAVTANALAANAVTAGTVAAGAIGANEIAAGAIRAQHLLIAPKSLNTDPSFEGGLARWSGFVRRLPSTDPAVPVDCPVTYASEFSGRDNVPTIRMSVQPGEVYKVSCWVNRGKGSGGAGIGLVGIEYDGTGARVAGYSMGATTAAGWQLVSVARTIGSSTTQVQFGVWADRTTYQGEAWYSELNIERVNDASLIVDGTITAAKLMAGSVTAGKIAANAVTAGNIAANAVTAGTVAAGAISTTELAAGAITTAKLGAKAVTTAALAAGAVTANELAANSVTADKLVANAVTAGTIAAGAVSSREIAAGAVTTDKLVVGNFDNLIPNGEFATGDLTNWRPWAGATSVVASTNAAVPAGATSSNVLRLDGVAGARSSLFSHTKTYSDVGGETDGIPVVAGQQYLVEFNVARTAAIAAGTTFFVRFYFRRKDGTGAAGPIITNLTTVASIPTAWSPISGTITIPSTTPDVERMYLYISAETSFTSGSIFVERVRCTRVSDATLIADGSIITQKLVTASVSSDKIATNAVTADKIVANAITGDKIAANAITAAKIAAGSISADHLMVGQSANMLVNPGFESDWYGWSNPTIYGTTDWGMNLAAAGAVLANTSNKTVYIKQTGGAGSSSQNAQLTQTLPCEAGKTYMATVYSGARRCNVWVVARFLNDAGQNVATTAEAGDNYNRQEAAGSSSLASYKRVWYRAKAPAGATKVSFIIVKESTVTGQADSYAFLARPYLGEVAPNQTDAPAWDAAGATVIGPGNISTGSLSAISANLGYIRTWCRVRCPIWHT